MYVLDRYMIFLQRNKIVRQPAGKGGKLFNMIGHKIKDRANRTSLLFSHSRGHGDSLSVVVVLSRATRINFPDEKE